MENERSKLPKWLKETQNKSWEPEIIISGLMLTSLFIIPDKLFEFCGMLVQVYGVDYLNAMLILMYLSFVINIFKLFFIVHLLLRLAWTGMVGLSYAFPNGVDNEKLFKVFSHYKFKKPASLVIKLERWCSILFAFPVYIGTILVLITFILLLIIAISTYFSLGIFYALGLFILLLLIYLSISFFFKESAFASLIATSIASTISSIYQSNLGKWPVQISVFIFMIFSAPFIINDIHGFGKFFNAVGNDDIEWQVKSDIYANHHDPEKRYARAFLTSETIKKADYINLSLAHYIQDEKHIEIFNKNIPDSLSWQNVDALEDLFRVYLNDSLIITENWQRYSLPITEQKILSTYLDVSDLPKGSHQIRVEKLTYIDFGFSLRKSRVRKQWAIIPFYKVEE
jgi:hypothetical protein